MKTNAKNRQIRLNQIKENHDKNSQCEQEIAKAQIAYAEICREKQIVINANNAKNYNLYKNYNLRHNLYYDAKKYGFNEDVLKKLEPILTEKNVNNLRIDEESLTLIEDLEIFLMQFDKDETNNIANIETNIRKMFYNDYDKKGE